MTEELKTIRCKDAESRIRMSMRLGMKFRYWEECLDGSFRVHYALGKTESKRIQAERERKRKKALGIERPKTNVGGLVARLRASRSN